MGSTTFTSSHIFSHEDQPSDLTLIPINDLAPSILLFIKLAVNRGQITDIDENRVLHFDAREI